MSEQGNPAVEQQTDEPAIKRKMAEAKAAGRDLKVRPPKARKTKIKNPKRVAKGQSRIQAQEKRRRALEARKAGMSYQQIAEVLGYHDASGASKAVHKAFAQLIQEPVAELKTLQVERINHLIMAVWNKAQAGDERSIATVLALMDKLDRYEGTEQVQTTNVHHSGGVLVAQGSKDDFIAAMKQMAGVSNNGTNLTAVQESGSEEPKALPGVVYPPGMGMALPDPPAQPVDPPVDVVDADVVEDEQERDTSSTSDVRKTYRFGVDPTVKKGDQGG